MTVYDLGLSFPWSATSAMEDDGARTLLVDDDIPPVIPCFHANFPLWVNAMTWFAS